jgi:F-type H+-transporting ATPase subunit gamma
MRTHQLVAELETLDSYQSYVDFLRALAQTGKVEAERLLRANAALSESVKVMAGEVFAAYAAAEVAKGSQPFASWGSACAALHGHQASAKALADRCLASTPTADPTAPVLLLVIGSNRGLCGSFHRNLIDEARKCVASYGHVKIACVGRHTRSALVRSFQDPSLFVPAADLEKSDGLTGLFRMDTAKTPIQPLSLQLLDWFMTLQPSPPSRLEVIYTDESTKASAVVTAPWLPVPLSAQMGAGTADPLGRSHILEPSAATVAAAMLEVRLRTELRSAILRSSVAEHRMRLQESTRAHHYLEEQSESTRALMRKTRREKITTELVGLLSGAEAYKDRE